MSASDDKVRVPIEIDPDDMGELNDLIQRIKDAKSDIRGLEPRTGRGRGDEESRMPYRPTPFEDRGGIFGGETTCDAKDYGWGFYNEPVKAKRPCLHPDRKKFPSQTFVVSSLGFCAALGEDPTLIVGGKDDNTKLVEVLTGIQVA